MVSSAKELTFDLNPYDSFMKRHLQHYGYFADQVTKTPTVSRYDVLSDSVSNESEDDDTDVSGSSTVNSDLALYGRNRDEVPRTTQLVYSVQAGRMVVQLREPRQLYGLYSGLWGPQQPARWPSGLQMVVDRVRHIHWEPPEPELFYKPTGSEETPMAMSHRGHGRVVYEYEPSLGSFFARSSHSSNSSADCEVTIIDLESAEDTTLLFESRFESANLAKAVQVGPYDYELWLRTDLYTDKHTQWYYFRVSNTCADVTYRFTIVNHMKPESLYNCGMRPLMYSTYLATNLHVGWMRTGDNIKYYKNNITYTSGKYERSYYSLTWTCSFQHSKDTVYFAHCYPYTYSDLQDYINNIVNDPFKSKYCRHRLLCRTLAGNLVYLLTITSPMSDTNDDVKQRKAVVLSARVHPGETNASWMMKGFLDFLLSGSRDAKLLCDNFVFKIVPMLNPDGVIVGNYRCSMTGRDLNRAYKSAFKETFPSIWHTKNMIKSLLDEREVIMYCDLHGHSRQQNVFVYGCENRSDSQRRFRERVFPYMLSRNAPDMFSYDSCRFHVQKSKEGTGRVVMWNLGIQNSYTLEATFCGSSLGKTRGSHFTANDFQSMGYYFCDTLLDYCDPDVTKVTAVLHCIEERVKTEIFQKLRQQSATNAGTPGDLPKDPSDVDISKHYSYDIESSDGGSDSSVDDDTVPVQLQFMSCKLRGRKKLKTRKERNRSKACCHSAPKDLKRVGFSQGRQCLLKEQQEQIVDKKPDALKCRKPLNVTSSAIGHRHCRGTDRMDGEFPVFLQERFEDGNARKVGSLYFETRSSSRDSPVNKDVPGGRLLTGTRHFSMIVPSSSFDTERFTLQKFNYLGDFKMPPDGIRGKSVAPSNITMMPYLAANQRLLQQRQAPESHSNSCRDDCMKYPSLTVDQGQCQCGNSSSLQASDTQPIVDSNVNVASGYEVLKSCGSKEAVKKRHHIGGLPSQASEMSARKSMSHDSFNDQTVRDEVLSVVPVHHNRHLSPLASDEIDEVSSNRPATSGGRVWMPGTGHHLENEIVSSTASKPNFPLAALKVSSLLETEVAGRRIGSGPQRLPRRPLPTANLKRPNVGSKH